MSKDFADGDVAAKVVAEEDIPQNVMADRGKNGNFCVRFFPVGD